MGRIIERKGADYDILKDNHYKDWFLDSNFGGGDGYISYGQFIVHALWKNSNKDDDIQPRQLLDNLYKLCKEGIDLKEINNSNIVEVLYCHDGSGDVGILIRDKSKGCYPLYIDNYRIGGFLNHIEHIQQNWTSIVEVLKQCQEWSPRIEGELNQYYFDPKH